MKTRQDITVEPKVAWSTWQPTKAQPWDRRRAAHLIRRAGFGETLSTIDDWVEQGVEKTLDDLFALNGRESFDKEMAPTEKVLASSQDPQQLASWWLLRMQQTPCQLLEKSALFWHGHFATGAAKVDNSRAMLVQNRLLRDNALGKFEPMVQGISRDVAMLIYLDSQDNRKTRPNENYARELMELFCLGPGNYTEADIKELARCFTGWQIQRGKFRFNQHQHDTGSKTVLGQSGQLSGEQAVRVVMDHPACSKFLARKLVRYFVVDGIDLTDDFIEPVASQLRDSDFELGSTLRMILSSRFFYSDDAIGQKVRSPVEMAIGLVRTLNASTNMIQLRGRLSDLGHLPMYPPNVKGWEGGRRWINASTYFGRSNLVSDIARQNKSYYSKGSIAASIGVRKSSDASEWVSRLCENLVAVPLTKDTTSLLLGLADKKNVGIDQRVADVICAIGATPEFQLS